MDAESSRARVMHRLSMLCALLVITIVGISAFIRLSGVGLGCAPWPQCYGQALRDGQHEALPSGTVQSSPSVAAARLAHRFLAVLLLTLMLVLVISGFSSPSQAWDGRWLSVQALLLIVFLAGLGRWTAGTRVPAVVLGNLLGGFLLLGLCWRMARMGRPRAVVHALSRATRMGLALATAVVLAQVALGGLVSSGFAGLSCPQIAACTPTAPVPWEVLNPLREPHVDTTLWPVNPDGAVIHLLHRWLAAVTTLVIVAAAVALLRDQRRRTALALLLLVGAQSALGFLMVYLQLPLTLAVLHNLLAALLLGLLMGIERDGGGLLASANGG